MSITYSDVIFSSMKITKGSIYTNLKTLLLNAGWQNLSSNTTTDYDVFYSTGTSGNMNLYFNFRNVDASASNPIDSTTKCYISMRFINKYTAGTTGVSGTFDRNETWYNLMLFQSNSITQDTMITMYYHVNKNRIIFFCVPNLASTTTGHLHYIGLPQSYANEHDSTGLVLASTGSSLSNSSGYVRVDDNPDSHQTTSYTMNTYFGTIPQNISSGGKAFISRVNYGNTSEGIRGTIDGIFHMNIDSPSACFLDGDILVDNVNNKKYRVCVTYYDGADVNSFSVATIGLNYQAIQIQ